MTNVCNSTSRYAIILNGLEENYFREAEACENSTPALPDDTEQGPWKITELSRSTGL